MNFYLNDADVQLLRRMLTYIQAEAMALAKFDGGVKWLGEVNLSDSMCRLLKKLEPKQ